MVEICAEVSIAPHGKSTTTKPLAKWRPRVVASFWGPPLKRKKGDLSNKDVDLPSGYD